MSYDAELSNKTLLIDWSVELPGQRTVKGCYNARYVQWSFPMISEEARHNRQGELWIFQGIIGEAKNRQSKGGLMPAIGSGLFCPPHATACTKGSPAACPRSAFAVERPSIMPLRFCEALTRAYCVRLKEPDRNARAYSMVFQPSLCEQQNHPAIANG